MGAQSLLGCLLLFTLMSLSTAGLVRKVLRHRRQTLSPHTEHNATLPSVGHPMVFSHVYNINVPASSLCSVDLEASEGTQVPPKDVTPVPPGHHVTEHTLNGENQIVFTHRINIPRQACGCTDDFPGLKDLVSRLEMLEGEVSALRDQCSSEQLTGELGTKPYCNGHGNYSAETCGCICDPGWRGPNCTEAECPGRCQDRGRCVDGKCVCYKGFDGEDCALETCPVVCGAHGHCVGGVCVCSDGFFGEDCSQSRCLNNCLGHGRCEEGDCVCDEPWTGFDCSELICPKDCYDRGRCVNGTCHCDEGFSGEDCGEHSCPNNCRGNGFCVDGKCICTAGYSGEDCSQLTCLNDCNGRGMCFNGLCICDSGYQGEDCSQLACLNNCNNRGQCINGRCSCDVGFLGDDCGELSCPNNCRLKGRCVNGQCVCDEGFVGEDCSVRICPSNCYGRGECIKGRCVCHVGFVGDDCSQLSCPNNCRDRGRCVDGQCVCDEGFSGEDCGKKACPNDCLARGHCLDGKCFCQEGYTGDDCSVLACPDNCNNRGRCVNGRCLCESGYEGESCADLSCINNCHDKGRCVNGQCFCDEGYIREDCSEVSPPKTLTVGDVSTETVDLSWNNEMLVTEYLVTYVPTSPGGLLMEFTVPGDKTAATVKELEPGIEYLISVYAVLSNKRSIPVSARVVTDLPQPEGLRFKSVRETSVEVVWDQLDISFDSWEIYFRNTKEENGKVVSTLLPSQTDFLQSGLGPGQEYEVSISIVKNNTRGPQTSKTVTTKIDSPRQVEAKDVTDSSALISWYLPVAPVDRVTMFYMPSSDPSDQTTVDVSPPDKQYNTDNLRPDTEYTVSIISRRGEATSDPVTTTFTTALDPPTDAQAVSQTDDSITLEWTNSQADVSSYRVKYSPISGSAHGERVFPRGSGHTTRATITGLKPGTEYGVGVTAVKNERESLPATTNAATDLDPPRDFRAVRPTETSLAVAWQKPQAKVGGYRLAYMSRDGQAEQVEIPASESSYVLPNLLPGTSYTLTLAAERGHRRSKPVSLTASTAASDDREQRTPTGSEVNVTSSVTLDPPESPISETEAEDERGTLTASGVASDGLDRSWEPKTPGASDSVAVRYKDAQISRDGSEVQLPGDSRGARVGGPEPTAEYQTELFGIKSSQGPAIHEATVTVTAPADVLALSIKEASTAPEPAKEEENLERVDKVQNESPSENDAMVSGAEIESSGMELMSDLAVNVTATSVSLTWSAPDDAFDSFLVETVAVSAAAAQPQVNELPGSFRKAEIEGLLPSTMYEITLQGLMEGRRSVPLRVFTATAGLEPALGNLVLSDITWDSFTASWSPTGGDFDSFVIEVINMEDLAERQNLTLSGDASSLVISGLSPNTNYMVGLYGMHQGSYLEPLYREATTVIRPVVGKLYVSNLTSESFTIHWNSTERLFDGFVLEIIGSDWLMELQEYNISQNVSAHDVTGLRPSTDYIAYLYGTYKGSRTRPVSIVASTAEEPDLSNLVVSNVTSDRFSLSWRMREKAFDTFVVEVRESALPSQAMGRTLPGDVRSTVMAGLKANTSYDIKLYASKGGRQNTQPLLAVATTEDVPQLGAIVASSANPHYLSLYWNTLSGHFDGFVVQVSDSEQQSDTLDFRLPGEARNITIPNLMDDTGYDIEVYGISHGRRTPSMFVHAVTAPLPKVENLTISNVTPYGFRASWEVRQQPPPPPPQQEEELSPSGGGFSHFHIVVTDSGWLLEPQEFTVPGDQSHLDIWGLITGIGYEVKLTGVSESGLLSRPLTTVAVTEAEPEVDQIFVSDITADSFRLSWTADEDQFDRFLIKIRDSKRLAHPQEHNVHGSERTKVITGLMSGTEYEFELYGLTLDQRSQPITGVVQTGLSAPRGLRFTEVTDSTAVVHWSIPRFPVDNYRITYVPFEGGSPLIVTVDGGVSETVLINMFPGKTYQVTLSSLKGLEESEPSTGTVTTALDSPRGLTVINVTDTSALLLWQPSVATVDGYVITYSADAVSPVVEHVSGNVVEFQMNTLVPGTLYTVGVYGVKEAQRSASTVTEFSTDVDPPRDLMAVNVQTDSATLTWQPPTAAVSGYVLTFFSSDDAIREVMLSPTASSYSMSQLTGSTEYSVRLQAISGGQRSRYITTTFSTSKAGQMHARPRDCAQILSNGETTSGLYTVYIGGEESQPIQVYCDMTTDGGGWLVFLRRQNGKLEFFRNWKSYTAGFGNMSDEFWLGLSNLQKITSLGHYELRVDLRDNGESAYAQYDKFTLAEPRTRYKVYLGAYSGTAGDSMSYHQGRPFSTYDNDNDIAVTNCALSYKGAFWYKNCHRVNLMGKYGDSSHSKGINWFHWKGHEHSIEFAEMKIRPANFNNLESRKKRS